MPTRTTLSPIDATAKALDALLSAIEGAPSSGAVAAYRAAITRHGRNLRETAGPDALAPALDRAAGLAPERAQERREAVSAAWAGLVAETASRPPLAS